MNYTQNNLLNFTPHNQKFFVRRPHLNLIDFISNQKTVGLKLQLKGRLKGVKRARKLELMKGKIKAQTMSFPIQAKQKPIQTKWGKIGLSLILGQI